MIPTNTPNGTLVVCIEFPLYPVSTWTGKNLVIGNIYTIENIINGADGFPLVLLKECDNPKVMHRGKYEYIGYNLSMFKIAVLPKSLTDILSTKILA